MAYNRKIIRKRMGIEGNCLIESFQYIFCSCCLIAQEYNQVVQYISQTNQPSKQAQLIEIRFNQQSSSSLYNQKQDYNYQENSDDNSPECSRKQSQTENFDQLLTDLDVEISKSNYLEQPHADSCDQISVEIDSLSSYQDEESFTFQENINFQQEKNMEQEQTELAIFPHDGNDPYIYSQYIGTSPMSYVRGQDYQANSPPPTYLPMSIINAPKPDAKEQILSGLQATTNGELKCISQEVLSRQKGILKELVLKLMKSIFSGLGTASITLPVRIFEPRSVVERTIDRFSFALLYLNRASQITDPFERLKLVTAFGIAGMYMGCSQMKPFNPLLGETFQGRFPDGSPIYVEHISHSPPIDNFLVLGQGYTISGYYLLDGKFSKNSLIGYIRGQTNITFANGHRIRFTMPEFILGGMIMGSRTLKWKGTFECVDEMTGNMAVVKVGKNKRAWNVYKKKTNAGSLIGKIFTPLPGNKTKILTDLGSLYGSWTKKLVFRHREVKEKLWDIDRDRPIRHLSEENPLPSDWRFREDLIWLYRGNLEFASNWKYRVEVRQRDDRLLRGESHQNQVQFKMAFSSSVFDTWSLTKQFHAAQYYLAEERPILINDSQSNQLGALHLQSVYGPFNQMIRVPEMEYSSGPEKIKKIDAWSQLGQISKTIAMKRFLDLMHNLFPS